MRVLFLGYEGESCSMAYLAERLESQGHKTHLALCDYYNFIDSTSIHEFLETRGYDSWTNFADRYERLYREEYSVDWEFLREFEAEYSDSKNFEQLLMTDPILRRNHHFRRPYYTAIDSSEQVYFWAEQLLRWLTELLEEFDPDIVLTYGRSYFVKNAAAQVAARTDHELLTIIPSRIGNYYYVSDGFSLGTNDRIETAVTDDDRWADTADAAAYLREFKSDDSGGLYEANAQQRIEDQTLFTMSDIAGEFLKSVAQTTLNIVRGDKRSYRGGQIPANYFNSHNPSIIKFHSRVAYNRLRYKLQNPFRQTVPERPFVYVPLHTIPESSTLTLSTEYYERDLVRFAAKELPTGMRLAVKENPNMVGLRPHAYYEELNRLPNVELVDPTVQSKRLIRASRGVCGISGTALLEAAILETPTHCFGCPEFEVVLDYTGYAEFPAFARACLDGADSKYPERVKRYVQHVLDHGSELDYVALRTDPGTDAWQNATETVHEMFASELEGLDA